MNRLVIVTLVPHARGFLRMKQIMNSLPSNSDVSGK